MSKEYFHSRLFTLVGPILIFAVLVCGGLLYASFGGSARDGLITQMLINAIIVLGIQIYVGNTGVLSFGHIGFGAIAGYAFAICAISPTRKNSQIPDAPFGLSGICLLYTSPSPRDRG